MRNDRLFSMRAIRGDTAVVRVAVTTSRAFGGAVLRNRARRRVREALRVALAGRSTVRGADIVVTARPASLTAPAAAIRSVVQTDLDAVLR